MRIKSEYNDTPVADCDMNLSTLCDPGRSLCNNEDFIPSRWTLPKPTSSAIKKGIVRIININHYKKLFNRFNVIPVTDNQSCNGPALDSYHIFDA